MINSIRTELIHRFLWDIKLFDGISTLPLQYQWNANAQQVYYFTQDILELQGGWNITVNGTIDDFIPILNATPAPYALVHGATYSQNIITDDVPIALCWLCASDAGITVAGVSVHSVQGGINSTATNRVWHSADGKDWILAGSVTHTGSNSTGAVGNVAFAPITAKYWAAEILVVPVGGGSGNIALTQVAFLDAVGANILPGNVTGQALGFPGTTRQKYGTFGGLQLVSSVDTLPMNRAPSADCINFFERPYSIDSNDSKPGIYLGAYDMEFQDTMDFPVCASNQFIEYRHLTIPIVICATGTDYYMATERRNFLRTAIRRSLMRNRLNNWWWKLEVSDMSDNKNESCSATGTGGAAGKGQWEALCLIPVHIHYKQTKDQVAY